MESRKPARDRNGPVAAGTDLVRSMAAALRSIKWEKMPPALEGEGHGERGGAGGASSAVPKGI